MQKIITFYLLFFFSFSTLKAQDILKEDFELGLPKKTWQVSDKGELGHLIGVDKSKFFKFHPKYKNEKLVTPILNYPSNPIGVTYTREEVKSLADVLKKYPVFVMCDEIYSELVYDETHTSIAEFIPNQTILINGLSKSHAMTGWRIGFLFGPKELIKEIVKVHQYLVTAASTISQKAAYAALTTSMNAGEEMKKEYQVRRNFVFKEVSRLGFEVVKPRGAFYIFAKIPTGYIQDSMEFCIDLAEKEQLAVIPGIAFGQAGEGYIRISYAASFEKLEEAMRRLDRYMNR